MNLERKNVMNKPNNYDKTVAAGGFTPIDLGGHILVIKEVLEMKSSTGKPMIKVSFDTADSDKQPAYFANQFRNDIRPDKKWPNNGCVYMLTEDMDGNCSRNFKTFTTSVEKSNPGFSIQWNDGFGACLKNKLVGGVFGIVNDFYNNKELKKRQLRWFRSVDKVNDAEIPAETETTAFKNRTMSSAVTGAPVGDGFLTIPDGLEEELPFN